MKGDIIDSYKALPVGAYLDILAICKNNEIDELDKQVKIIAVLTGTDEMAVLDLPIAQYKAYAAKSKFLEEIPKVTARYASAYKLGGLELVPVVDIRKVSTAQYIDFQTLHQGDEDEHLAEIISCLLIPRGKKYCQDYDIADVQAAIRNDLSCYDAMCLYAFFLLSCSKSIATTLTSSLREVKKIKDKKKRAQLEEEIQNQIIRLHSVGDGLQM